MARKAGTSGLSPSSHNGVSSSPKKTRKRRQCPRGQSQSCHQCRQSIFSLKGASEIKTGQKRIKCSKCTKYWLEYSVYILLLVILEGGNFCRFDALIAILHMLNGPQICQIKTGQSLKILQFTKILPAIYTFMVLLMYILFNFWLYSPSLPSFRCEQCLSNRYGLEQLSLSVSSWLCPVCSGNCNCSLCRKKVNYKLIQVPCSTILK